VPQAERSSADISKVATKDTKDSKKLRFVGIKAGQRGKLINHRGTMGKPKDYSRIKGQKKQARSGEKTISLTKKKGERKRGAAVRSKNRSQAKYGTSAALHSLNDIFPRIPSF